MFDQSDIVMRGHAGHDQIAATVLRRTRSALAAANPMTHDRERLSGCTAPTKGSREERKNDERDDARLAAHAILAEGMLHSLGDVTVHDLLEEGRRA